MSDLVANARSASLDLNFNLYGVPVTVYPVATAEVSTVGIWSRDVTEEASPGLDGLSRREARRVISIRNTTNTTFQRGIEFDAPEKLGDTATVRWRIEGTIQVYRSYTRHEVVRSQ